MSNKQADIAKAKAKARTEPRVPKPPEASVPAPIPQHPDADIVTRIDLKHHVDSKGRIVKTGNNVPIPDEEPKILFRGRDRLAGKVLEAYRMFCAQDGCNEFQLGQVDELIVRFKKFRDEHPEVIKQPGVTRGL